MTSCEQSVARERDIEIRVANAVDGEALVRFNRAMALETENRHLPEAVVARGVRAVFDDPGRGFYVVAERGAEIVAALMVTFEWSDWRDAHFWWIQSVYVTRRFRRSGIYRRLHEFVRDRAREEGGVCGFRLYVEKHNADAQRVYEALGMTHTDYLMYEESISQ